MGWAILFAQMTWESWFPKKRKRERSQDIIRKAHDRIDQAIRHIIQVEREAFQLERQNHSLRAQNDILRAKLDQQERFFVGNAPVTYFKEDNGSN